MDNFITVFTATYNRGSCLPLLYKSLLSQSFKNFEWVIVDDGSTDNTNKIVKNFNKLKIKYIKTKNKGKHNAINVGVKYAQGNLFFIVDSDDYLDKNALKIINLYEKTILEKKFFSGVCGPKHYFNRKLVGSTFSGIHLDITTLERKTYNITGDKSEVFYTSLLKKYPFPVFNNENFLTECVVWDRIAHDGYKMRFFNDPIYYCEYRSDGLSNKYHKLLKENPLGWACYIKQRIDFKIFSKRDKYLNIFSFCTSEKQFSIFKIINLLGINIFELLIAYFYHITRRFLNLFKHS